MGGANLTIQGHSIDNGLYRGTCSIAARVEQNANECSGRRYRVCRVAINDVPKVQHKSQLALLLLPTLHSCSKLGRCLTVKLLPALSAAVSLPNSLEVQRY